MFSYSSKKAASSPRIQLINGVSKFKTSNNPVISKQNKLVIQAKLAIQKQSTAASTDRIFNNKLYINYTKNPFMNLKGRQHRFSNNLSFSSVNVRENMLKPKHKKLSTVSRQKTIMDQMILLKQQNKQRNQKKLARFQKINDIIIQSKKISNRMMGQIQRQKYAKASSVKTQTVSPKKQVNKQQVIGLNQNQKKKIKQLSIDQIASMPQQNFFFHEGHKKINIFKCAHQTNQILSPIQQLNQYKFCFDKIHAPILRDITLVSREILRTSNVPTNKIFDTMRNQQLSIKQREIRFVDLMGIASGRLTIQVISKLNKDIVLKIVKNNDSEASEQQQQQIIMYKCNHQTKMNIFTNANQQKTQISQFSNIQLTTQQKQFRQRCQYLKGKIKKLLEQKQQTLNKHIYDKQKLNKYQQQFQTTFKQYLSDKKINLNDISKKVRRNKIFKSRNQSYQMSLAIQVFKDKNQVDSILRNGFREY